MMQSISLLLLGSIAGSASGFQIAAPISAASWIMQPQIKPGQPQQSSSSLFVGYTNKPVAESPRPPVSMRLSSSLMSTSGASDKMAIRMRKFILTLWRMLKLPMRLLRTPTTSVEELETVTVLESSAVAEVPVDEPLVLDDLQLPANQVKSATVKPFLTIPASRKKKAKLIQKNKAIATLLPKNQDSKARWATATVDLSGDWVLIASDEFKQEYDAYLQLLGQPLIVRGIALGIIGLTTEVTEQMDEGRTLFIRGINARGVWERSLISSGLDGSSTSTNEYEPQVRTVVTADSEPVEAEAWWEDHGRSHISWMRGVSKYGGGDFESKRHLENNGKVLVCESVFHPQDKTRQEVRLTWKFSRRGATL
mmetsp:Transcript_33029/g.54546  ORF Transcript_33029/g.54546 Transcript_33029/m.54546 type:complete len:366 (-) Transcript_33029:120-1217(-)